MKPNAPRMVTVLLAVALTVVGLALIYLPGNQIADLIRQLPLGADLTRQVLDWAAQGVVAWLALLLSPLLLIVGSLVRGL
jgi:hypothetical protein